MNSGVSALNLQGLIQGLKILSDFRGVNFRENGSILMRKMNTSIIVCILKKIQTLLQVCIHITVYSPVHTVMGQAEISGPVTSLCLQHCIQPCHPSTGHRPVHQPLSQQWDVFADTDLYHRVVSGPAQGLSQGRNFFCCVGLGLSSIPIYVYISDKGSNWDSNICISSPEKHPK